MNKLQITAKLKAYFLQFHTAYTAIYGDFFKSAYICHDMPNVCKITNEVSKAIFKERNPVQL